MANIPKKSFLQLHNRLIHTLEQKTASIEEFRQKRGGCLRITIDLWSDISQRWIYHNIDPCLNSNRYQYITSLSPYQSYYIQEGLMTIDCATLAEMQIAACRCAVAEHAGFRSENFKDQYPNMTVEQAANLGYFPVMGAICLQIQDDGSPWADIYVSIYGATPEVNKTCAEAAIPVITDFFCTENGLMVSGAQISQN